MVIPPKTQPSLYDVLVIGRAGLDLYPLPDGTKTSDAEEFASDLGGSAGNIAVALARFGVKTALAAPVSDDPVGQFVCRALRNYGVAHVTPTPIKGEARTSLALAETRAQGSETVIYRNNAADFQLPNIDDAVRSAHVIVVSGTALAREPSRAQCLKALSEATFGVLDLDYRAYSWDQESASTIYAKAAAEAHLIVGNEEEFAILGGRSAAISLAEEGKTVLYKKGAEGCEVLGPESMIIPPFEVLALKPFGAGDAYLGGVLSRLLKGDPLNDALVFGSAAAAIVVGRRGCARAMPQTEEVMAFLKQMKG